MKKLFALILALIFYVSILPSLHGAGVITPHWSGAIIDNLVVKDSPYVDVQAHGAVESLTDSSTMTANVTYIQNAIDSATASGDGAWVDLGGKIYHVNATVQARDKYSPRLKLRNGKIYGHDINGPVINFGGSRVSTFDFHVEVDNCWFGAVAYRTTNSASSFIFTVNSTFLGTATKAIFYAISVEVNDFVNTGFQNNSDAPVYIAARTDVLSVGTGVLVDWDGLVQSNTVTHWRGGYMWAGADTVSGVYTSACTGIRIYDGENYNITDVSFFQGENCSGVWLGNDSYSLIGVNIIGNRTESTAGTADPFVRITGTTGVNNLVVKNNAVFSQQYAVYADDNTTITYSDIGPNSRGVNDASYRYATLDKSVHNDTGATVSFKNSSGWSPQLSTVIAKNITYTAGTTSNPGISYRSDVTEYVSSTGLYGKHYQVFKEQTGDPVYSTGTGDGATMAFPDKTTWNPAGLGVKPAFKIPAEDGGLYWYQPLLLRSLTFPAAQNSPCTIGQVAFDNTRFGWCVTDNSWKGVAASADNVVWP